MGERGTGSSGGRVRSRVGSLLMASILATGGLGLNVITSAGALVPADAGTVVVEPSTDLIDRQTVTVTAEGFDPLTSFGAAQCDPSLGPGAGLEACDLSTARTTTTDADGRVQLDMPVRRIITVQGRVVDCALEPCILGAATISGTTPIEVATTPISFDPEVPPVAPLVIEVTVHGLTDSVITGTITCNREAEAFLDAYLRQQKGTHAAIAYGYSEEPLACDTSPTEWAVSLVNGSGRLTGGQADYEAYASAYDGFESASSLATGQVQVTGGGQRRWLPPGEQPGETVRVQIAGTSGGPDGLLVDLVVTCDRPVAEGFVYVAVTQWAGLDEVAGYGGADLGPCDGVEEMSVPITSLSGSLVGGPAQVEASVEVYDFTPDDEFFDFATARTSVRLRGSQHATVFDAQPNPGSRITITGATRTTLTGILTCEEPVEAEVGAFLQQRRGRVIGETSGYELLSCDGSTPFSIELDQPLGGGSAVAFVYATAFRVVDEEYQFLWEDQQAASLNIRS